MLIKDQEPTIEISFKIETKAVVEHRVMGAKIEYTHPIEQMRFETDNPEFDKKRIKQLEELVPNLITHRQKLIHKWPVSG